MEIDDTCARQRKNEGHNLALWGSPLSLLTVVAVLVTTVFVFDRLDDWTAQLDAEPRRGAQDEGGERNGEEAEEVRRGQAPALHRVRDPEVSETCEQT